MKIILHQYGVEKPSWNALGNTGQKKNVNNSKNSMKWEKILQT